MNFIDEYISQTTWKAKENANLSYSFSSLFMRLAGNEVEKYVLNKVYHPGISKAHINGDLHIHNLYFGIAGYCAGWSVADLLLNGFNGVPGKTESSAPKHLSTALLQIANFAGTIQNEWAGAMAFNSLDTYLAPFVRKDKLNLRQVKQQMQQFVYNMNISSRWGGQTVFSNVTFDLKPPKDLENKKIIINGKLGNDRYSDFQKEMDMLNRAFIEVMVEGDMKGRIFTFPIPTYSVTKDFDWDSPITKLLFQMAAKYGVPYFQNFINSDLKPEDIRSMCCHLRLDLRKFHRRVGGFFGFSDKTGSVGVVTINMPRIGYLSKSENEFFERLEKLMELAKDSLEIKRKLVQKNMDKGLFPFSKRYLRTLKFHFSTIGLVGMNETCLNFLGKSIAEREALDFSIKTLKFMREKLLEFQKKTGNLYNLEETPAESTCYRLAILDRKKYPKIITAGTKAVPYYTNSTHLPVGYTDDIFFALKHQEPLQILYTGGTVFHIFLGESPSPDMAKKLVKRGFENFRIPYLTLTPTFSICLFHGYIKGEHKFCPKCRKPAEVYSRVVGYYRPIQSWNKGKQREFAERKTYLLGSL